MSPAEIRSRRRSRGWTQRDLARRVGATPRTIQNWEAGTVHPHPASLAMLEILFGVRDRRPAYAMCSDGCRCTCHRRRIA